MKQNSKYKKGVVVTIIALFVGASAVSALNVNPYNKCKPLNIEAEKIFNELKSKLDTVTTKQGTITLFKEIIVKLNDYGLLPKGMTVKRTQRLVTWCYLKSELIQTFQNNNENNAGNSNCFVVGITNNTFFRPYPTIYDIPIIYYLRFNTSFGDFFNFLIWFYVIRASLPFKLGPYAYVGERYKLVENGNTTYEHIDASSGWVWTNGLDGVKKWNGTFYGSLYTKYRKSSEDDNNYAESWLPVGIRGFVGINLFNSISMGTEKSTFYIGFAREVNFTYSPPWT
jgi:hypothetical protein